MKTYEKPIILTNMDLMEGVYADSGYNPPPENPSATATLTWTNHNSGSHSDLECKVFVSPNCGGEHVAVTLTWQGNGSITSVGGYGGGYTSASFDGNSVTFIRDGHFNPGECFSFTFNNVVFTDTGDGHVDPEHVGSYYEGQGNGYLGDASGTWAINVSAS